MSSPDSSLPPLATLRDEIQRLIPKSLVPNLKAACQILYVSKSGRKHELQTRLMGRLPLTDQATASDILQALGGPSNSHLQARNLALHNSYSNMTLRFRASPFYTMDPNGLLCTSYLKPSAQTRNVVTTIIMWNPNQLDQLRSDSSLRVLVFCGERPPSAASTTVVDVAFPQHIELKIGIGSSLQDVKANFKGIKKRPGSTNPVDITALVKVREFKTPKLEIHYALTDRIYDLAVVIAKRITIDELSDTVKGRRVISKEQVLLEMRSKAQDDDIVAGPTTMSLKDSVSYTRISVPCRGLQCRHYTCFDLSSYLEMQKQAPLWTCPVCDKKTLFDQIAVDKYFEEILQNAPSNVDSITVQPNGEWSADPPTADDDSDSNDEPEDLIVISPPKKKETAGHASVGAHSSTPGGDALRGTKRHSEVIDLTLSSEDEGPRPPKRSNTGSHIPNTAISGTNSSNPPNRMSIGGHSVANSMARTEGRPYSFNITREPSSSAFMPHSHLFRHLPAPQQQLSAPQEQLSAPQQQLSAPRQQLSASQQLLQEDQSSPFIGRVPLFPFTRFLAPQPQPQPQSPGHVVLMGNVQNMPGSHAFGRASLPSPGLWLPPPSPSNSPSQSPGN
jgi:E3 SUMO-protein ligase PIAS1